MNKKILVVGAGLVIGAGLGILILFVMGGWDQITGAASAYELSKSALRVGFPAPDFELDTISGEKVRLSDLRGSTVIINFWATWCEPCKAEMPLFQERFTRYTPKLRVLAVNFEEPENDVKAFIDKLGLTFDILLDPRAAAQELYKVHGYPTTYFVDRDGIIQVQHMGTISDHQLDKYLAKFGLNQ
jgi:peroxiredoxin